jgi:hypothetical protein
MAPKKKAPADGVDHSPFADPEKARGANTPKRGISESTSLVWHSVKRLKSKDVRGQVSAACLRMPWSRFTLTTMTQHI